MPKRHAELKEYSIGPSKGSTANCAQLNEVQPKIMSTLQKAGYPLYPRLGYRPTAKFMGCMLHSK